MFLTQAMAGTVACSSDHCRYCGMFLRPWQVLWGVPDSGHGRCCGMFFIQATAHTMGSCSLTLRQILWRVPYSGHGRYCGMFLTQATAHTMACCSLRLQQFCFVFFTCESVLSVYPKYKKNKQDMYRFMWYLFSPGNSLFSGIWFPFNSQLTIFMEQVSYT